MEKDKILEKSVAQLMEHFDSIQILASFKGENGNTCSISRGSGNYYSRLGLAHEFIQIDKARTYEQIKREEI